MRFAFLGCFCALMLIKKADAGTQVVIYNLNTKPTASNTTAQIDGVIFEEATPVLINEVWIVDLNNVGSTNANCKFSYSGGVLTIGDIGFTGSGNSLTISGASQPCFFTFESSTSTYTLTILSRSAVSSNNDNKFSITISPTTASSGLIIVSGTQAFPPFPTTIVPASDYNPTLTIRDKDGNEATLLKLGESAFFRFTMIIPNYVAFIDDAGARLSSCDMSETSSFSSSVVIIDTNGCFTNVLDKNNTEGFTGSAANSGGTRTFTAETPWFPVINFVINNVNAATKELHFRCFINYCDDGIDTTPGNCGGPHCSAATRRKRESRARRSVTTSVRIERDVEPEVDQGDESEKCTDSCSMSVGYKSAVGGLGGLTILLLGGMLYSYVGVMKEYAARRDKAGSNAMSTIAKSTSGRTGTMSVVDSYISARKPASHVSSRASTGGESKKVYMYD